MDGWGDFRRGARKAAVVFVLYRAGGRWMVPFVRRRTDLRDHPGQVALPGGGVQEGETAWDAAQREVAEEIGVPVGRLVPLGAGDRVVIVAPGCSDESTLMQIEDGEWRPPEIPTCDDLVPRQASADILQVQVVLVGPEPGHLVVRLRGAGHHAPYRKAVTLRRLEVLDPDVRVEQRAEESSDVPGGEDVRSRRVPELVHHDAAIHGQAAALGQVRSRL